MYSSDSSAESSLAGPRKIDSSGRFLPFRGVTVIAQVREENKEMWEHIYKSLDQNCLIREYFSLLPVQSYHMTTIDLYTEVVNPIWDKFVSNQLPRLRNLNADLQTHAFQPQVTGGKPMVSSVIMFLLKMNEHQKEKINLVAKKFQSLKKVPQEFHVTLAYSYKKIPHEASQQIKKDVNDIFESIIESNPEILFEEPKLCYFRNMTEFTPWDGKENPFSSK